MLREPGEVPPRLRTPSLRQQGDKTRVPRCNPPRPHARPVPGSWGTPFAPGQLSAAQPPFLGTALHGLLPDIREHRTNACLLPDLLQLHLLGNSPSLITEWSGLEGTSGGHPVQTPCRSRVTQSRLHRTLSRQVLNISREGDSTTSLGSLCQGSVTLRGKKFFLRFRRNFLCFSLCPLPLVLSLGTTEKSLAPSSLHPPCRHL